MKSRYRLRGGVLVAAAAVVVATTFAAAPATKPAASTTPAAAARSTVNPDAMKALRDMGAFLRTLKAFQVDAAAEHFFHPNPLNRYSLGTKSKSLRSSGSSTRAGSSTTS